MDGFYLSPDYGEHWIEVTEEQWRRVERGVGFLPTGGFSSGPVSGSLMHPASALTPRRLMVDPAKIAEEIREEMVCCDIYEQMLKAHREEGGMERYREMKRSSDYHASCYYFEWAARRVEEFLEAPSRES